jgi:hypothetical protein
VPDHPDRAREPDGLRCLIELTEMRPGSGPSRVRTGIHCDSLNRPQVQHHPAVTGGESCGAVAATSYGERQLMLAGEAERSDHVRHAATPRDAGGVAVEDRIPHDPGVVVVRMAGQDNSPAEPLSEGR